MKLKMMKNSNNLFKQQFLMHSDFFCAKLVSKNARIQVLIGNLRIDIIESISMNLHDFLCIYERENDEKLKQFV
jgi:hypothetical protein